MNFKEYLDILSQPNNVAGGGSASAISGAISIGLILKSYNMLLKKNVNLKNNKYIVTKLEDLQTFYLNKIFEDGQIFGEVLDAYKLPKNTEEEINIRKKEIQDAYINSYYSTFSMAYNVVKIFNYLEEFLDAKDDMVKSELGVAIYNLISCFKTSMTNSELNLKYIKNKDFLKKEKNSISNLYYEFNCKIDKFVKLGFVK